MSRFLTDRGERELQRLHEESPAPLRLRTAPRGRPFRLRPPWRRRSRKGPKSG